MRVDWSMVISNGGQLESYGGQLESFCYFDHHTHFLARIVIILSCNHEL